MTIQELLQLLGAKEVDLYLAKKQIAELEARLAALGAASNPPATAEAQAVIG